MKTTLNKIRDHAPCRDGWEKLLKHLGKTKADDEPLSLLTILESNGLDDALWCLRAVDGYDKEMRLYAVWCAWQVQHSMQDYKSIVTIHISERDAHGQAIDVELTAATYAAYDAAWRAARDAAWNASWCAAGDAAWDAVAAARAEQEAEFRRMLNAIEDYAQCA